MKRVSKFELIRIIAMYLIVLHHAINHGVFEVAMVNRIQNPVNTIMATILEGGGKIGVYLFVLITGYFMATSKISLKKVLRTWLPVFFWSLALYLGFQLEVLHDFSFMGILKATLPITTNQYWFVTVYFFMYLSVPLLNTVINSIETKRQKLYFIILGFVVVMSQSGSLFGQTGLVGSQLLAFYFVYCVGGLIRKNCLLENEQLTKKIKVVGVLIYLCGISISTGLIIIGAKLNNRSFFSWADKFAVDPALLFVVVNTISLFIWLGSSKIRYHYWINRTAKTTFGVYLISDNSFVRNWLWNQVFNMGKLISTSTFYLIIYVLTSSLIVFVVCSLLEAMRQSIFKWKVKFLLGR